MTAAVGTSGSPGEGFYTWAKEPGRFTGEFEDKRAFWEAERRAVDAEWRRYFRPQKA